MVESSRGIGFDGLRVTGMTEQLIEAHLSSQKTFAVTCLHCNQLKIFKLSDLPPDIPNPFGYDCPCGAALKIMLDSRNTYRKNINLAGSFTVPSETKKIQRFFNTLDISATGMRIETDYVKTIAKGLILDATLILQDKQRTKLDLACVVQGIVPSPNRLILGLEFKNLNPYQQQALGAYLMA